jgi:pyruvate dehydrogenase E1 component alpha subunit
MLLENNGVAGPELETRVAAAADRVAAALRAGVKAMTDPEPLTVFDDVYAEPHAELQRQRDDYARYLDGFAHEEAAQ